MPLEVREKPENSHESILTDGFRQINPEWNAMLFNVWFFHMKNCLRGRKEQCVHYSLEEKKSVNSR